MRFGRHDIGGSETDSVRRELAGDCQRLSMMGVSRVDERNIEAGIDKDILRE